MNQLAILAVAMSLLAPAGAHANNTVLAQAGSPTQAVAPRAESDLRITRAGSLPSRRGPAETFTGIVRNDPLLSATAPSRLSGASVTFEPGARSAWHTHPVGQVLIVTSGVGWVQREGGPVEEMRPGDVVWIPPGVKHWHGAAATTGVTHLAMQEHPDGQDEVVDWMEHVSDEQYRR